MDERIPSSDSAKGFSSAQQQEIHSAKSPEGVRMYIRNNPRQTALHIASGILLLFPALLTGPMLFLLGFGPLGPIAASIAAAVQSCVGAILPFRILQSAAMGGYGVPIVAGLVRLGSFLVGAFSALKAWFSGN